MINRKYFRFTHLQHTPFIYTIKVMNNKNTQTRGTVRIFLTPKFDEQGKEFKFNEIRLMMIEMDRFEVNCKFFNAEVNFDIKRFAFS